MSVLWLGCKECGKLEPLREEGNRSNLGQQECEIVKFRRQG